MPRFKVMGTKASTLEIGSEAVRWRASGFPLGTVLLSVGACLIAPNGSYAVVALALVWFPYLVLHPQAGLWYSPVLVMAASLLAVPEGFIAGWGYSPQLAYWAVAVCVAFLATSLAVARWRGALLSRTRGAFEPPLALHVLLGVSVAGAALGMARGYSLANVGKQFFGCLLFAGYFWFALKLTPGLREMRRVVRFVAMAAVAASLLYVAVYVPAEGLVRDTVLNDLSASVACLLLPQWLSRSRQVKTKAMAMSAALLLVPLVNTFKRSVAGFAICALLLYGLRSPSRKKRYLWLAGAFTIFALLLATPLLNYVGRAVAKQPVISKLIPMDVQTNYSVYLRVVEAEQKLASSGGLSWLGTGLGSSLTWYNPYAKAWFTEETVALGWAYVIIKLGVLGLGVFVWLIGGLLIRSIRQVPAGAHLALALLVAFFTVEMVASPVAVYFATAPWVGMACGWLHILNERAERSRRASSAVATGSRGQRSPVRGPSTTGLSVEDGSAGCP